MKYWGKTQKIVVPQWKKRDLGYGYWITQDGSIIDVSGDVGGGTNDHTGFLSVAFNASIARKMGVPEADRTALRQLYKTFVGTPEAGIAAQNILHKNTRVRVTPDGTVAVTTDNLTEANKSKVISLIERTGIHPKEVILEDSDEHYKTISFEEFMSK
jgi:hypothetical protein